MSDHTNTPSPARGGERPCHHCGSAIPATRALTAVYCSTGCLDAARDQRRTIARRPTCGHCGDQFTPRANGQRYCGPECSYGAALRKQRGRDAKRNYKNRASDIAVDAPRPVVVTAPRRVTPLRRAATLAETPDVPAVTAARGDYLTGGAAATMQAVSGGRNLSL